MTMEADVARFMIDEKHPFVPKSDKTWRALRRSLDRAKRGGDPSEISVARAELAQYVAGRTKSVLDEYYEEPPAPPSSGPSSASVGGMFDMSDAFDSVMSVEEPIHPAHLNSEPIPPAPRFVPPTNHDEQRVGGAPQTTGSRFSSLNPLNRLNPLNPFGIFRRLGSFL